MFEIQLKTNPDINFFYSSFDELEKTIRQWYRATINPNESAMEYVFRNYYVYIGPTRLKP